MNSKCNKERTISKRIVFACTKLTIYILGDPKTIRSNLKYMSIPKRGTLRCGRLKRWILAVDVEHDID